MGKLTLTVEDAPVKTPKNEDLYKEVVEAFNGLEIGKSFVVKSDDIPSSSLVAKIRDLVTLKDKVEGLKISRIYEDAADPKKLTAIRLIKIAYSEPKPRKPKAPAQGTEEATK